jgi:membrane protein implicated in regulation of membrane protease activity
VLALFVGILFGICLAMGSSVALPLWIGYMYAGSAILGIVLTILFYRLRRPRPPQTSFYQPVRIKNVRLQFSGLMAGEGHVGFMRLAFTNPDYLSAFAEANQEAIKARRVAIAKA